jgi:hypothetical protein
VSGACIRPSICQSTHARDIRDESKLYAVVEDKPSGHLDTLKARGRLLVKPILARLYKQL